MSHSLIPVTKRKKWGDERGETDCGKDYIKLVEENIALKTRYAGKQERRKERVINWVWHRVNPITKIKYCIQTMYEDMIIKTNVQSRKRD